MEGCQAFSVARFQEPTIEQRLARPQLIASDGIYSRYAEHGAAFILVQTIDGNAVYAEHEGFQVGFDLCHIASSIDDARLKSRCMRQFQNGVYVFQVRLPEFEYLCLAWMEGRKLYSGGT